MSNVVALVCNAGAEYTIQRALYLAGRIRATTTAVDEVAIFTNQPDAVSGSSFVAIPFSREWPGWWAKLELFNPQVWPAESDARVLYMDMDSMPVGDLAPLFDFNAPAFLRDFYRPHKLASGVMGFEPARDRNWMHRLWHCGITALAQGDAPIGGDQVLMQQHLGDTFGHRWQDDFPGKIRSWKADGLERNPIPPDTRLICWHGKPRPWEVGW